MSPRGAYSHGSIAQGGTTYPTSASDSEAMKSGAYTLNGATTGNAVAVNPGAAFYIPTENEWYKAAYYSPNYGGVSVPGYYAYATQSDSPGRNQ